MVILNNGGYLTERLITDGSFNDIQPWRYAKLPELFGGGRSFVVETEDELDAALDAVGGSDELCILDVHLGATDASPALHRLAEGLREMAGSSAATGD